MQDDNDFGVMPEEATPPCKHGLDESTCKLCKDAKRQRDKRERERNEKQAKAASDSSQTLDAFWKAQRSLVSASTLAPMLARQETVFDTLWWLTHWLDGSYNDTSSPHFVDPSDTDCYVSFEEGATDIIQDYETFGFCQTEISWNEFWKDPDLFQMLTSRNDATATFARYGLLTAIPSHLYDDFQQFLKKRLGIVHLADYAYVGVEVLAPDYKPPAVVPAKRWGQMFCALCPAPPVAYPQTTIDALKEAGIKHFCPQCMILKRNLLGRGLQ